MIKDPVCGMMVNSKNPPATIDVGRETYYFCCDGCKKAFENDPAKFLAGSESVLNISVIDKNFGTQSE